MKPLPQLAVAFALFSFGFAEAQSMSVNKLRCASKEINANLSQRNIEAIGRIRIETMAKSKFDSSRQWEGKLVDLDADETLDYVVKILFKPVKTKTRTVGWKCSLLTASSYRKETVFGVSSKPNIQHVYIRGDRKNPEISNTDDGYEPEGYIFDGGFVPYGKKKKAVHAPGTGE